MIKKVAIIGGGFNSAIGRAHFSALKMIDHKFKIVAGVFSRNFKVNVDTASVFNNDNFELFHSYDLMLEKIQNRVDVILILSPTDHHYEHAFKALEMGFDVISEKAVALTVEEAKILKNIALRNNRKFIVIYNYLGYPMLNELREKVMSGKFGKIIDVHLEMPQEGFLLKKDGVAKSPQEWRLKDGTIPTISLDLGVHLHIILYHICGLYPISVSAIQTSTGNFSVIDNVKALIKFQNGASGSIWFSKNSLGSRNGLCIKIFGKEASAFWLQTNPEELFISGCDGSRQIIDRSSPNISDSLNYPDYSIFKPGHPIGFVEALKNYYLDVHDYLSGLPSSITYTIDEGILGLELLENITRAAEGNCWINFSK